MIHARWVSNGKECWQIVHGLPEPALPWDEIGEYHTKHPMFTALLDKLPLHFADELYPNDIVKTYWDCGWNRGYGLMAL